MPTHPLFSHLNKALRAVPDDLRTRSALADAYLTEYWAHTQLISVRGLDYVLQRGRSQRLRPPRAALLPAQAVGDASGAGARGEAARGAMALDAASSSLSPQRAAAVHAPTGVPALAPDPSLGPGEWDRIVCANRALLSYHELQSSLLHTRCAKCKLSYRDDILGMAIAVTHFHSGAGRRNNQNQHHSRGRAKGDGARGDAQRRSSELPIVRIDKVHTPGCTRKQHLVGTHPYCPPVSTLGRLQAQLLRPHVLPRQLSYKYPHPHPYPYPYPRARARVRAWTRRHG